MFILLTRLKETATSRDVNVCKYYSPQKRSLLQRFAAQSMILNLHHNYILGWDVMHDTRANGLIEEYMVEKHIKKTHEKVGALTK